MVSAWVLTSTELILLSMEPIQASRKFEMSKLAPTPKACGDLEEVAVGTALRQQHGPRAPPGPFMGPP